MLVRKAFSIIGVKVKYKNENLSTRNVSVNISVHCTVPFRPSGYSGTMWLLTKEIVQSVFIEIKS